MSARLEFPHGAEGAVRLLASAIVNTLNFGSWRAWLLIVGFVLASMIVQRLVF